MAWRKRKNYVFLQGPSCSFDTSSCFLLFDDSLVPGNTFSCSLVPGETSSWSPWALAAAVLGWTVLSQLRTGSQDWPRQLSA
jgi:hypothetical protein